MKINKVIQKAQEMGGKHVRFSLRKTTDEPWHIVADTTIDGCLAVESDETRAIARMIHLSLNTKHYAVREIQADLIWNIESADTGYVRAEVKIGEEWIEITEEDL